MTTRAAAGLVLLLALVLLGAASATWTRVSDDRTITTGSEPGSDVIAVLESSTDITGAELAGSLFATALAALVLAVPLARWRGVGLPVAALGAASLVVVAQAWPVEGTTTPAPGIAAAAAAGLVAAGLLALRSGRPATAGTPSRYTVEAARGERSAAAAPDEWDLAVLDDDAPPEEQT